MTRTCMMAWACVGLALLAAVGVAEEAASKGDKSVDALYPGLASGALTFARPASLSTGTLLRVETVVISAAEFEKELANAPEELQPQLKKNAFFLLENLATKKLLLHLAKKNRDTTKADSAGQTDSQIIRAYLEPIVKGTSVTDAEVREFYQGNKDMFGGATLEQVKAELKEYLLQQKQQNAVEKHIRTLGKRMTIEVAAPWFAQQAALAKDNPVDKARASSLPSLVDFGASGCGPCDMMTPILAGLKKKYEGELNVVFVHVREEQILAARYGIESIPVQIFFGKDGKEAFRHTGFFPLSEIEKKLSEIGVK